MRRVEERIVLTMREAVDLMEALSVLAQMDDFDEIVGYDICKERQKARRIYKQIDDLLYDKR